jgi:hypothetical protein
MKYSILALLCIFFLGNAYGSYEDSLVSVTISLPKKTASYAEDLLLGIKIKSNTNNKIIVPKYLSIGYIYDSSGFICIQLQKKTGNTYENVMPHGTMDNLLPDDVFDTLSINDSREISMNISGFSVPCYGSYRIRVLCFFSAYNYMPDVYSDWLYYNCRDKVYPITRRKNSKTK